MRQYNLIVVAFLCCATTTTLICNALPVSNSNQELDVFNIPLSNGKELDVLELGAESQVNDRNKRTIGILRDLFPEISKQIEDQVNKIVAQLLRTLGPTILRTAIQGNSANRPSPSDDFDADFDDDDVVKDDDSDSKSSSSNDSSSTSSGSSDNGATRIKVELPTFKPDDDDDDESASKNPLSNDEDNETKLTGGDNSIDLNAINQQLEETIRVARQTNLNENALANSINSEAVNDIPTVNKDQEVSESKAPAIDELSLDSLDDVDGDDRNKRQGLFGGGSVTGGGGAGSGNFLFDIIRLFSGSVQTQGGDQRANDAPSDSDSDEDSDEPKTDSSGGYTEAIPGPVTRLVVLANRGFANLIQDLILRVAATSERLVNFKARLITALI